MKDLITALSLFTDIKLFKKIKNDNTGKFVFCYFPFIGLIILAFMLLGYFIMDSIGFGFMAGVVAAVAIAVITGNVHFGVIFDYIDKSLGAIIYIMFLVLIILPFTIKEIVISAGVFILARALAILLFADNDNLQDGLYKSLLQNAHRLVVSIITVVWIMAGVAIIQMISIIYFAVIFVTFALLYFIFSHKAKVDKYLTDGDINLFIVVSEAIVLAELFVGIYLPYVIKLL